MSGRSSCSRESARERDFAQRAVANQDLAETAARLRLLRERVVELLLRDAALLDEHTAQPVRRGVPDARPLRPRRQVDLGERVGQRPRAREVFAALFLTGMSSLPAAHPTGDHAAHMSLRSCDFTTPPRLVVILRPWARTPS